MDLITTTSDLAAACSRLAQHKVITVDTEFLRETTYYPLLCVVQMASADEAVVVDTLAPSERGIGCSSGVRISKGAISRGWLSIRAVRCGLALT